MKGGAGGVERLSLFFPMERNREYGKMNEGGLVFQIITLQRQSLQLTQLGLINPILLYTLGDERELFPFCSNHERARSRSQN